MDGVGVFNGRLTGFGKRLILHNNRFNSRFYKSFTSFYKPKVAEI